MRVMREVAIRGWGMAVPETVRTSAEIAAAFGREESWIVERTGIRERRVAGPSDTTSSLAAAAARQAFVNAGMYPGNCDLLIVATTTPDRMCPATAPVVAQMLGARNAGAFDVSAACAGFVHAMGIAADMIRSGSVKRAVVIGAEVLSRFVDRKDPNTAILFGDGAGAVVLESTSGASGVGPLAMGADGDGASFVQIPGGASLLPASEQSVRQGAHFIKMNGKEVYRAAVRTIVETSQRSLRDAGLVVPDIDVFICHQANRRIIDECAARLGIAPERVFTNVERYGNTSAASIPIALAEAVDGGYVQEGSRILLAAIGAGLVWASTVVTWTAARNRRTRYSTRELAGANA